MKLFCAAGSAISRTNGTCVAVMWGINLTIERYKELQLSRIKKLWPPADGWYDHKVSPLEIPVTEAEAEKLYKLLPIINMVDNYNKMSKGDNQNENC